MKTMLGLQRLLLTLCLYSGLNLFNTAAAQQPIDTITLAGWSKPISEITQLLAEPELQHFKQQDVELIYLSGAGGGDALRNVLSGQADIAFTDPGSFFTALDKGAKLRAIYDIYPQNIFNVVSLASSGITTAADLKGKRIGVYSLSSGTRQNLQILLHQAGLSEDDVEIIVTGLLNFAPLMQGQVDATAATDTGLLIAQYRGLRNYHVIQMADYLNYSSDLFVVSEDSYQNKKDQLQRFLRGYQQSTQWMINNPDQAAQLAVRYAIDGQDPELNKQIIEARNQSSYTLNAPTSALGTLHLDSLQAAANTYYELGLINQPLNLQPFVSSELLP